MEKAVCTSGVITLQNQKRKSSDYRFLCVGRLINILFLFLLQHLNWIERYSTMKIGRFFFVWVYILAENFNTVSQIIRRTEQCELPMKTACKKLNFNGLATCSVCNHIIK